METVEKRATQRVGQRATKHPRAIQVIKIAILTGLITLSLTGCELGNTSSSEPEENVTYNTINIETFKNEFNTFVKGDDTSLTSTFKEMSRIDERDICTRYEIISTYTNGNAVYCKVKSDENHYLYRFQFNQSGVLESYIKYVVEA